MSQQAIVRQDKTKVASMYAVELHFQGLNDKSQRAMRSQFLHLKSRFYRLAKRNSSFVFEGKYVIASRKVHIVEARYQAIYKEFLALRREMNGFEMQLDFTNLRDLLQLTAGIVADFGKMMEREEYKTIMERHRLLTEARLNSINRHFEDKIAEIGRILLALQNVASVKQKARAEELLEDAEELAALIRRPMPKELRARVERAAARLEAGKR